VALQKRHHSNEKQGGTGLKIEERRNETQQTKRNLIPENSKKQGATYLSAHRARVGEERHGAAAVDVGLESGISAGGKLVLQVAHHHLPRQAESSSRRKQREDQ